MDIRQANIGIGSIIFFGVSTFSLASFANITVRAIIGDSSWRTLILAGGIGNKNYQLTLLRCADRKNSVLLQHNSFN
jgi:hypothetical protein